VFDSVQQFGWVHIGQLLGRADPHADQNASVERAEVLDAAQQTRLGLPGNDRLDTYTFQPQIVSQPIGIDIQEIADAVDAQGPTTLGCRGINRRQILNQGTFLQIVLAGWWMDGCHSTGLLPFVRLQVVGQGC
jgi:hypothetical protein